MNYFFHYSLHWPCYIITHTHTHTHTHTRAFNWAEPTSFLHLFHSEGDLKKIKNVQEIYIVLNVITLNVYKISNLPRAFKQECTPPSPYAWHIGLYIALGVDFDFSEVSLQILAQFFASKKHNCIFDIVLIVAFFKQANMPSIRRWWCALLLEGSG